MLKLTHNHVTEFLRYNLHGTIKLIGKYALKFDKNLKI
jgi:hypothetical protein